MMWGEQRQDELPERERRSGPSEAAASSSGERCALPDALPGADHRTPLAIRRILRPRRTPNQNHVQRQSEQDRE